MNLTFNVFLFQRSLLEICQKRDQTSVTMVDVKCLSNCELRAELDKLGFSPGPILRMYTSDAGD